MFRGNAIGQSLHGLFLIAGKIMFIFKTKRKSIQLGCILLVRGIPTYNNFKPDKLTKPSELH